MNARKPCTAVLLLAAMGALAACSPVTPKGWSARQQCGPKGNCWFVGSSPDDGRWLNFRVGMDHDAAIAAACDAVRNRHVSIGGFSTARDGHCAVDDGERASSQGFDTAWFARSEGFWCLGGGAFVALDINKKDGRLERIAAYCQNTFDP
jgi:hypothetical protein